MSHFSSCFHKFSINLRVISPHAQPQPSHPVTDSSRLLVADRVAQRLGGQSRVVVGQGDPDLVLERAGADVVDLLDGGEDIGIGIEGAVGAAETGPREEVEEDAVAGDVVPLGVVQAVPLAAVIEGGGGAVLLGGGC